MPHNGGAAYHIHNQFQKALYIVVWTDVIQTDKISRLQALLEGAHTFQCQGVDCYERYWDLTDAAYLERLEPEDKPEEDTLARRPCRS